MWNSNFAQIGDSSTSNGGDAGARAAGFKDYGDYLLRKAENDRLSPQYQQQQNEQKATALAATQKADMDSRFATDKQDVNNFNTENQALSTATNNQVMDKYHVPDLVTATNGLDTAIKNLQFNSNGGGAQGVMSQSGMDSYLNNVQLPKFATASDALSRASTAAEQEYGNLMTPENTKGQLLNDRLAREMSGFTSEQQRELDGLVQTMQSNAGLTTSQLEAMTSLANAEKQYQATLAQIQGGIKQAQIGQQYQIVPSGNTIYNTWLRGVNGVTAP